MTGKIRKAVQDDGLNVENRVQVQKSVDPLCEKYYAISPYVYCEDNPINSTDPDGMESMGSLVMASSYVTPNGVVIEHRNDNDPRVYLVTDIAKWRQNGSTSDGLSIVGYEDPNKTYQSGDHYTYYLSLIHI